jgi:signal-transduction protein with cAMP-binding, CBS, and nucleotidyltransferase domain
LIVDRKETAKIIQAAQLMAAKRTDAVLAVNSNGELTGILTDKDISYRVVAEQLDLKTTLVKDVMTRDPIAVYDKGSRNEALSIMISRKFRYVFHFI